MGKITLTEAEGLMEKCVLSKTSFNKMQKDGLVGTRKRGEKRNILTAEKTWCTPQFYFQGLNKKTESEDMKALRNEVNEVIKKRTVTKQS